METNLATEISVANSVIKIKKFTTFFSMVNVKKIIKF